MGKKPVKKNEANGLTAVYVGDSRNYHIYQIVDENVVGSLYFSKEGEAPKAINIELLAPNHDRWNSTLTKLRDRSSEGSKQYEKLTAALTKYGK